MSQITRLILFFAFILTCVSAVLITGAKLMGGLRAHAELLAFVPQYYPEQAIMLADVITGAAVILTHDDGPAFHPSWSADGSLIAYMVQYPLHNYALWIVVIDVTGREVDRFYIAPNMLTIGGIDWSPDARQLVFSTETMVSGGVRHLYVLDIESGAKRDLHIPVGHFLRSTPLWTPEGSAITLLTSAGGLMYLTTIPLDPVLPFTIQQLTNRHVYIALSPRLDRVIVSDNGTPKVFGIVDLVTGDYAPFPDGAPPSIVSPAWSPDGDGLLIVSDGVYLVSPENTYPPRRLIALPGAEFDPALRP